MKSQYYSYDFNDHFPIYGDLVVLTIQALEYLRLEPSCEKELGNDLPLVMQTLCTNLEVFSRVIRRLEKVTREKGVRSDEGAN